MTVPHDREAVPVPQSSRATSGFDARPAVDPRGEEPPSDRRYEEAAVREQLIELGWRHGEVLPLALLAQVQALPFSPQAPEGAQVIAVIVSQDCDIVHHDFVAEPAVEVLLLHTVVEISANHRLLKNPRLLHLQGRSATDTVQPMAASVWARGMLDRRLLLEHEPSRDWRLSDDERDLLSFLLARRYDRASFPDEFVRRFAPVAKRLEKIVERESDAITDILLRVRPSEELPMSDAARNPYTVSIYLLVSKETNATDVRRIASEVTGDLMRAMVKTPGIDPDDVHVQDPYTLMVGVFTELVTWDHDPLRLRIAEKALERAERDSLDARGAEPTARAPRAAPAARASIPRSDSRPEETTQGPEPVDQDGGDAGPL